MKTVVKETTAIGVVPMENFIPRVYLEASRVYKERFEAASLEGKITESNRTSDQALKDVDAIELLKELKTTKNVPLAYGFMWYNQSSIVKIYWAKRVGKFRKNKADFFQASFYLEWLNEIYLVLTGHHPAFTDPLYYYKLDTIKKDGTRVGFYDVMNSFRVQWNRFLLSKVAQYLNAQDKAESADSSVLSIDAYIDEHMETGASARLEADLARNSGAKDYAEETLTFLSIESFLRNIYLDKNLSKKILEKNNMSLTYRDVMKIIVNPETKNPTQIRSTYGINYSVYTRVIETLKKKMSAFDVSVADFAEYLGQYWFVAIDILDGKKTSYLNLQ